MNKMKEKRSLHQKAMDEVNNLRHLCKYYEATKRMRLASCGNMVLAKDIPTIQEQGIDSYYNLGDVLISSTKSFMYRKDSKMSYESWSRSATRELESLYKCKLTGEYCIARIEHKHVSDSYEGDNYNVMVKVDLQTRCPGFDRRKNLTDKVKAQ